MKYNYYKTESKKLVTYKKDELIGDGWYLVLLAFVLYFFYVVKIIKSGALSYSIHVI
jgi:hypothetical protein